MYGRNRVFKSFNADHALVGHIVANCEGGDHRNEICYDYAYFAERHLGEKQEPVRLMLILTDSGVLCVELKPLSGKRYATRWTRSWKGLSVAHSVNRIYFRGSDFQQTVYCTSQDTASRVYQLIAEALAKFAEVCL